MTEHRRPVGVKVSPHARDRFRERFPTECAEDAVVGLIYREVQQALAKHRYSAKLPSWCERAGDLNHRHQPQRFVWNPERTRCYPLMRDHTREHERTSEFGVRWIVKTVLAAMTEEQRAEQERLRGVNRERTGNRKQRYGSLVFGGKRGSGRKIRR